MKHCQIFAAFFAAAIALTSCGKKTPPAEPESFTVTGDMTSVSGKIQNFGELAVGTYTVKLEVAEEDASGKADKVVYISQAAVADDGSFTLALPATMQKKWLYRYSDDVEDMPSSVTVSNPGNAYTTDADIVMFGPEKSMFHIDYEGYKMDAATGIETDVEGGLGFSTSGLSTIGSFLDKDLTGEETTYKFDFKPGAGWSWSYIVSESGAAGKGEVETVTSTVPQGIDMSFTALKILYSQTELGEKSRF